MSIERFNYLRTLGLNRNSEVIHKNNSLVILKTLETRIAISDKEWQEFQLLDKK